MEQLYIYVSQSGVLNLVNNVKFEGFKKIIYASVYMNKYDSLLH